MCKGSHKDFACLLNILESIEKIITYSQAFINAEQLYQDSKSFDAL